MYRPSARASRSASRRLTAWSLPPKNADYADFDRRLKALHCAMRLSLPTIEARSGGLP